MKSLAQIIAENRERYNFSQWNEKPPLDMAEASDLEPSEPSDITPLDLFASAS